MRVPLPAAGDRRTAVATLRAMEPGEFAIVAVQFIEERNGRALVRLPNGSNTSIAFDALAAQRVRAYLPADGGGPNDASCSACDWKTTEDGWHAAYLADRSHWVGQHSDEPIDT